jgi:predicted AAA+ superfamily ATPase
MDVMSETTTNDEIPRTQYIARLDRWRDKQIIKVITGIRRSGKSTLLQQYSTHLEESKIPAKNIRIINFESLDQEVPRTSQELNDYIVSSLRPGKNYLFLDEVQQVEHFEKVVDSLFLRDDIDLYITGSNSNLLSGELATLLTGRYIEIQVLPLSFAEWRKSQPSDENPDTLFNTYLLYGGLPYVTKLTNPADISDYLGGVFNTILVKDVAGRNPQFNIRAFNDVAAYTADNIGNPTSLNSISRTLANAGLAISPTTVGEYLQAMILAGLIHRVPRYNLKGKALLRSQEKYYLTDLGFRYWFLNKSQGDIGHRIDNVVYVELLRRFKDVRIGKLDTTEIDFVANGDNGTHYYQVSASILDEKTRERELASLQKIADNYPKTILTLDRIGTSQDVGGIRIENLVDWLLR